MGHDTPPAVRTTGRQKSLHRKAPTPATSSTEAPTSMRGQHDRIFDRHARPPDEFSGRKSRLSFEAAEQGAGAVEIQLSCASKSSLFDILQKS